MTRSPAPSEPDHSVPVTTVPAPWIVNERSTWSTAGPSCDRSPGSCAATWAIAARTCSMPVPARAEQSTIGTPSSTSARASSRARAESARSVFVTATTPARTPSARSTAACSTVCGITPSSAATTSRNRSTPVAPATIVRTKRS